jgi:5-methylcytosine-specific restriction protein A
MSNKLPLSIPHNILLDAIKALDNGYFHLFSDSTGFDVLFRGRRYPPKAVVGVAAELMDGIQRTPYDFKGGPRKLCFKILEDNGFFISSKNEEKFGKPMKNANWSRDELILALDLYSKKPGSAKAQEVKELSMLLNQLGAKLGRNQSNTYRNVEGVYMKLMNFRRFDPEYASEGKSGLGRGNKQEGPIWEEYANNLPRLAQVAAAIRSTVQTPGIDEVLAEEDEDIVEASEGRILTRLHRTRERNKKLVKARKDKALQLQGHLRCEACNFDFVEKYGARGVGFIEAHHTKPVHTLAEDAKTKLEDLALICANCHRMIHARRPWLTMDELRALFTNTCLSNQLS